MSNNDSGSVPKKKGRPKKDNVLAKKAGNRGKVGRPKGDAAIMNEYKARMLASPKSAKVLETILSAALDDEHKNQAAAWKMLMDRMAPLSHYDKARGGEKPIVQINVTSMDSIQTIEPIDGELDGSD